MSLHFVENKCCNLCLFVVGYVYKVENTIKYQSHYTVHQDYKKKYGAGHTETIKKMSVSYEQNVIVWQYRK